MTTRKAEATRTRILETALALFQEKGYEATTMRDIAAAAESSLGLTYRYFERKEELVMALYERLAGEFEDQAQQFEPMPLADGVERTLLLAVERLTPHQESISALFSAAMNIKSGVAVLGGSTTSIRIKSRAIYRQLIERATNPPRMNQRDELADVLYGAHLAVMLFWLYDQTPDKQATRELIRFGRDALALIRPVLGFPPVAAALTRLAKLMGGMINIQQGEDGHDQHL